MDSESEYESHAVIAVHVLFGHTVSTIQPYSEKDDEQLRAVVDVGRHCESESEYDWHSVTDTQMPFGQIVSITQPDSEYEFEHGMLVDVDEPVPVVVVVEIVVVMSVLVVVKVTVVVPGIKALV